MTQPTRIRVALACALLLAACTFAQTPGLPPAPPKLTRAVLPKPKPAPAAWRPLIGDYASGARTITVLEHAGKLIASEHGGPRYVLERIDGSTFRLVPAGASGDLRAVFGGVKSGAANQLSIGERRFERADPGRDSFHIRPLRPVNELIAEALRAQPPVEAGEFRRSDLVDLTTVVPSLRLDIRYATANNFLSTPVYSQPRAFLQRPAAEAVARAARRLAVLGFGLLVHDAYRPWYVTKVFWEATPPDKREFVADPRDGSRHNRGCAVDLTLYELASGRPVEMPGGYDEMSARSYPDYQGGTSLQRWHRDLLRRAMEAEGFTVYEAEWWHFDYKDWRHYAIGNAPFEKLSAATHK